MASPGWSVPGDTGGWEGIRLEVMDMDGSRGDKVLIGEAERKGGMLAGSE